MEAGEAGSVRATAAGPSGALWWVSGTARGAPSSFPQRVSRAWMEMKPAAEQRAGTVPNYTSGSFPRPGNRACVSTRDATPHRRHHPWTGDPEDPVPSATLCRPTSHHPRVCLPSHRCGGLSLRPAVSGRVCGWGGVPWCVLSEQWWPALMVSRASAGAVADPAPGRSWHVSRLQVTGRHRGKHAKFLSTLWGLHALVELCPLVLQSTPENWTAGRIWFQSCMGKEKATLAVCPSNEADAPTHAI